MPDIIRISGKCCPECGCTAFIYYEKPNDSDKPLIKCSCCGIVLKAEQLVDHKAGELLDGEELAQAYEEHIKGCPVRKKE